MRISYHTPVNNLARKVTSTPCGYVPCKKVGENHYHSYAQPPLTTIIESDRRNPSFTDLTGSRFGRFTVVGLARGFKGRWVVRCVCGKYEMRRQKAIINKENYGDCCQICRHLQFLKSRHHYKTTGDDSKSIRDF